MKSIKRGDPKQTKYRSPKVVGRKIKIYSYSSVKFWGNEFLLPSDSLLAEDSKEL